MRDWNVDVSLVWCRIPGSLDRVECLWKGRFRLIAFFVVLMQRDGKARRAAVRDVDVLVFVGAKIDTAV